MPDAAGRFRGIAVPAIPWCQVFAPGDRVRSLSGYCGTVMQQRDGKVSVRLDHDVIRYYKPGELRSK